MDVVDDRERQGFSGTRKGRRRALKMREPKMQLYIHRSKPCMWYNNCGITIISQCRWSQFFRSSKFQTINVNLFLIFCIYLFISIVAIIRNAVCLLFLCHSNNNNSTTFSLVQKMLSSTLVGFCLLYWSHASRPVTGFICSLVLRFSFLYLSDFSYSSD